MLITPPALDAAMNAPHIQMLMVEAGGHDKAVGGLYAQNLAQNLPSKRRRLRAINDQYYETARP